MENNEINDNQNLDNQDNDNQQENIDTQAILEENERLKKQIEADKHIKERLAKKAEKPKTSTNLDEDTLYSNFKKRQELENFISKNPELSHLEEDFKKLTSSGLSPDEAKIVLEKRDPTIANRQKSESMTLTVWELPWKTEYTKAELEDLPQDKYNEIKKLQAQGKVTIR